MKSAIKAGTARGGVLLVLAAAAFSLSGLAHADGTPAGTDITNKATLSFSVGGVNQSDIASSPTGSTNGTGADTVFRVDNKVQHTVVTTNGAAVTWTPGQATVTATFTVTNNGNKAQEYGLAVANLASGTQDIFGGNVTDSFDVTLGSCTVQVDGVTRSFVPSLAIDASATVTVACPVPAGLANGALAGISLTATAATSGSSGATAVTATTGADTAAEDIVFADTIGSDDLDRDGKHSARSAYVVVSAALRVTKTVALVCDPVNGTTQPKAIPGAYMRYTILVENTGGAPASLGTISDTLHNSVEFDQKLIQAPASAAACASTGAATSADGDAFMLTYAQRGYAPKYLTQSGADGDGASYTAPAGGTPGSFSINFGAAMPAAGGYANGELRNGHSRTLVYQVRIR